MRNIGTHTWRLRTYLLFVLYNRNSLTGLGRLNSKATKLTRVEPCPKCGKQLIEREKDYYCLKDDALFDKQTRQQILPEIYSEETESDYEEAKRRFRANMKGVFKKTDSDVDKIMQEYEKSFAEKKLSPFRCIATLESRQELEIGNWKSGAATGLGYLAGGIIGAHIARSIVSSRLQAVPLRGSLTPEQRDLTESRLKLITEDDNGVRASAEEDSDDRRYMKQCVACGAWVPKASEKCKKCGSKL